jgi:TetR/AcrR family transcriptional repressor of nem operon
MPLKKGDKTKERIVRAATRLIHTRGYKNTSLNDIFAESGVNKGSFYFHFSGKDELVHAVIDRFLSSIERRLEVISGAGEKSPRQMIVSYLNLMTTFMEASGCVGGCLLGNLSLEVSDWHEQIRGHLALSFDRFINRFALIIREGQNRGEFRTDRSAEEIAVVLVSLLEGGLVLAKAKKDIAPLVVMKENALEYMTSGEIVPLDIQ